MHRKQRKIPCDNLSTRTNVPWSVHAEFSIHRNVKNTTPIEAINTTAAIIPNNKSTGVRMTYSFIPNQITDSSKIENSAITSLNTYDFKKRNGINSLLPLNVSVPIRSHTIAKTAYQYNKHQSVFPTVSRTTRFSFDCNNTHIPTSQQLVDKRCISTCNIVLTPVTKTNNLETYQHCEAQSHLPYPRPWSTYCQQHVSSYYLFNAMTKVGNYHSKSSINYRPYNTQFCNKLPSKNIPHTTLSEVSSQLNSKDAASQTTDIEKQHSSVSKRKNKRKTSSAFTSSGNEEIKNYNFDRLLKRPISTESPTPSQDQLLSDSSTSIHTAYVRDENSEKRKRTVHIDVYCTGTDDDLNNENNIEKNLSFSNANSDKKIYKTIFEDSSVCITHTKAENDVLPRGFQDESAFLKFINEKKDIIKHDSLKTSSAITIKEYDSDDMFSSLYPSQFSSYSRFRDVEASITSSASGAFDEYDSASPTSWKDTISDIDSLVNSKASLVPFNIDYADSVDQEQIRCLEKMIEKANVKSTTTKTKIWRPQPTECTYSLQKKMKGDFIKKHPSYRWTSKISESSTSKSDDSGDEIGWSFVSSEDNISSATRKLALPQLYPSNFIDQSNTSETLSYSKTKQESNQETLIEDIKSSIFHERISPFGSISSLLKPMNLQSTMISPFTTPQGEKTNHIIKASVFGRVVNTVKKPGHHVGPAKNPACLCEHCRRHFEKIGTNACCC